MTDTLQTAQFNDEFRSNICGAEIQISPSIQALTQMARANLFDTVRLHDNFERDHNPHPEHDLGVFILQGQQYVWQIRDKIYRVTKIDEDQQITTIPQKIMTIATTQEKIMELNDSLRIHGIGGRAVMTNTIAVLPMANRHAIIQALRQYNDFSAENDRYGEHDFGAVNVGGQSFLWKIDYYDKSLRFAAPEPYDESVTERVLTVMRVREY